MPIHPVRYYLMLLGMDRQLQLATLGFGVYLQGGSRDEYTRSIALRFSKTKHFTFDDFSVVMGECSFLLYVVVSRSEKVTKKVVSKRNSLSPSSATQMLSASS